MEGREAAAAAGVADVQDSVGRETLPHQAFANRAADAAGQSADIAALGERVVGGGAGGGGGGQEEGESAAAPDAASADAGDDPAETEADMRTRHAAELAQVDADLQEQLSHVGKSNRKKKKALWAAADDRKAEIARRHADELAGIGIGVGDGGGDGDGGNVGNDGGDGGTADAAAVTADPRGPKKKSKAARRREKQQAAERARAAALRLEASTFVSGRDVEMQQLNEVLGREGLKVHDIPADGNCLYHAVSHQLVVSAAAQGRRVEALGAADLRRKAADHMLAHRADFEPFFDGDAGADAAPQSFEAYCTDMASSSRWGGQLELRALSEALGRHVVVYGAAGVVSEFGAATSSSSSPPPSASAAAAAAPLRVSFHQQYYALGEHFNSVVAAR